MRARLIAAVSAICVAAMVAASPALGHGISSRQDVPIPTWLFGWGATMVLVVSFVALASLWPTPRLQQEPWRPLPRWFSRVFASGALEILCGAVGVFLLGLVVYSGLRGTANAGANFAPTFVYIVFWLLPLPLSVLFGDVFPAPAAARC